MIYLYLILLIIAPQLWYKPIIGLPVDYIIYPIWFIVLFLTNRTKALLKFEKIDLLLVAMIGWTIISIIINPKNQHSTKIILDYIKFFLIFRFVAATITDFKDFKKVIHFLVFLIFILAFESIDHKTSADGLGWVGQPLGWADTELIKDTGSGRTQWINIFDGPGVFCVLFTIGLPFIIQHFDKHYSIVVKTVTVIGASILSIAIYFTGSRGGFLASLVCLFAYVLSRSKLTFKQLIIAASLAFSVFMMAPAFLTSLSDSHHSAQKRVDMWIEGVEMTKYNPIFGIGKGNFQNYTGALIAHNSAIEVMGETGLPGFYMWLSIIFLSFKNIRNFYESTEDLNQKSYAVAQAICIVGYLASSMFITLEYETFYFILGLAAALGRISGKQVDFKRKDGTIVFYIIVGWIIFLKLFFIIY